MGANARKVVDLSVGQPDFPTPEHIRRAGGRAIEEGYTRYTPQPGFEDLRQAVARKFREENGLSVSPDEVVVSCGAKHSLYNVINCIAGRGDEVIVLSPHWPVHVAQIGFAGATPVFVPTVEREGFQPDPDAIRAAVTPATRAIIVATPCNPTGAVHSREALAEIADLAVERDLTVVADEVYERILFDGAVHVSVGSLNAEVAARTVTVNSVSKTHSMTGWRIGYAALPPELAQKVTRLQANSTSGPCAIAQRAALAALTQDQSHVTAMVTEYAARRRYLLERLEPLAGLSCSPPQGTFYFFLDMAGLIGRKMRGRSVHGSTALADLLLQEAGVKVLAGAPFGSDRHVRLSFAVSTAALEEGMDRIEGLLAT